MKSCKECRHCEPWREVPSFADEFAECGHPRNSKGAHPVTGVSVKRFKFCTTQRYGGWIDAYMTNTCGPQARWYQTKEEK